jgi:hypothetical protein
LLNGSIRQRGRPATGHAKTGAQRQSARRERLKLEGKGQLTVELPQDVLDGLSKFIQFKDLTKDQVVERLLRQQLMRRR